ncbi:unnamed protein product [Cuscuta europaea]|uniref:Protein SCAR n=1 Tax=Cuscuta europaea TaxID=41803 RepID=A0A9P1DXV6_CUSEU|nr:unnamed protein product [Cuscuta europaea]
MPLSRYKIRNEFSLADPELYRSADKDDPEFLLEGVAMAGLVGVLRQLGDLAEFAAEIFHDLHEEVLATAARGHSLSIRVQQLEADFPSIEKALISQTNHSLFFYSPGTDWHPNIHMEQNLVTQGDLPRFVMDSYEECRGPPRLFLLDKFDIAGAGACLKRYTDPSFFKEGASSFEMTNSDFHREKRTRKAKKKGPRGRNGEAPEALPTPHVKQKLHQLFMEEEHFENGNNDSVRRVKLKRRLNGFPFDSKTGKSYMEKFSSTPSPEHKVVDEASLDSLHLKLASSSAYQTKLDYIGTRKASGDEEATHSHITPSQSPSPPLSEDNDALKQLNNAPYEAVTDDGVLATSTFSHSFELGDNLSSFRKLATRNEMYTDRGDRTNCYHSDDAGSEIENYVDALASMDSDLDTGFELRARAHSRALDSEKHLTTHHDQIRTRSSDSQSMGKSTLSDDANSVLKVEESSFSSGSSRTSHITIAPSEAHAGNMTDIREIHMCYSPVDLRSEGERFASPQLSEHAFYNTSTDLVPLSTSSLLDCSVNPGIAKGGNVMREDALVKQTTSEILSHLDEDQYDSIGVAETGATPHRTASASIDFDNSGQTVGDLPPIASGEKRLLSEIHTADLNEKNNIACSTNQSDVPYDNGDDFPAHLPVNVHNGDLSNNFYSTSNPFIPQKRGELWSTENKYLDMLVGELLSSEEDTNCLDNLSHRSTSNKDGYFPSSYAINYSTNEVNGDVNIAHGASVHLPNIMEASLEEEHVTHDFHIASKDETAKDYCTGIGEGHLCSPNLLMVQTEKVPLDSASKIETNHTTSVKLGETLVSEEKNAEDTCSTLVDGNISPLNLSIMPTTPQLIEMSSSIPALDTRKSIISQSVQAHLDVALNLENAEKTVNITPGPNSTVRKTSLLSPDSTSGEDPGALDEVAHTISSLNSNEIDVYHHFQPDALMLDHNKTRPIQQQESPIHCPLPRFSAQDNHEGSLHLPGYDSVKGNVLLTINQIEEPFDSSSKSMIGSIPSQPSELSIFPHDNHYINLFEQYSNPSTCISPGVGLPLGADQTNLEEMPPLPPLPPVQWRMGKSPRASPRERELTQTETGFFSSLPSKFDQAIEPLEKSPLSAITDEAPPSVYQYGAVSHGSFPLPMSNEEFDDNGKDKIKFPTRMPPVNSFSQDIPVDKSCTLSFATSSEEFLQPAEEVIKDAHLNGKELEEDLKSSGGELETYHRLGPLVSPQDSASVGSSRISDNDGSTSLEESTATDKESMQVVPDHPEVAQPELQSSTETGLDVLKLDKASEILEENVYRHETVILENESTKAEQVTPEINSKESECENGSVRLQEKPVRNATLRSALEANFRNPLHRKPNLEGDIIWPAVEDGAVNESKKVKLPRTRSPLIDAVAAHDKSKMKKVVDRDKSPLQKAGERDTLLEEIRSKSFSLKPTVITRPTVQFPQTNLRVAAILERAKTIRQAFAGSDEEDDEDSWD